MYVLSIIGLDIGLKKKNKSDDQAVEEFLNVTFVSGL